TIAGLHFNRTLDAFSLNIAIGGMPDNVTAYTGQVDVPIAGSYSLRPGESAERDVAVGGFQITGSPARNIDLEMNIRLISPSGSPLVPGFNPDLQAAPVVIDVHDHLLFQFFAINFHQANVLLYDVVHLYHIAVG